MWTMRPEEPSMPRPRTHAGFSLVMALFLIVILALLGTVIVMLAGVQRQSVNLSLLETRGYYAARSGIEWGTWQAVDGGGACNTGGSPLTLNGFSVTVSCTSGTHTESGKTYTVYVLNSTAGFSSYGQPDYVSRTIQATVIAP